MKKVFLMSFLAFASVLTISCSSDDNVIEQQKPGGDDDDTQPGIPSDTSLVPEKVKDGFSGVFSAEGKEIDTKFTRVLYAAEGSETEGESDDVTQLIFDSVDPKGNAVKVKRFQLLTKNTGATTIDELQSDDPKMKQVINGAKLFIEIPVNTNGDLILEKAYVGNLGYTMNGGGDERHQVTAEEVADLVLKIHTLNLPTFDASNKPGDKAIKYGEGTISFEFTGKVKHQNSETRGDFNIKVHSTISVTHIRGAERASRAVAIDPAIVAKNKQ